LRWVKTSGLSKPEDSAQDTLSSEQQVKPREEFIAHYICNVSKNNKEFLPVFSALFLIIQIVDMLNNSMRED
jgi:hypothetical protein